MPIQKPSFAFSCFFRVAFFVFCAVSFSFSRSVSAADILWTDGIQAGTDSRLGFGYVDLEHPIGTGVTGQGSAIGTGSDSNGSNASRVADPAGGSGYALRLFADFGPSTNIGGARAEVDLLSLNNATFATQAESDNGIYVAQEWYFPTALSLPTSSYDESAGWINLWDWHSVGGTTGRWHTSPGLMLQQDGSMRVRFNWNRLGFDPSAWSSVGLPVGRWFPIEEYYKWSTGSVTMYLWIDGQLAITQTVPYTRAADHTGVETNIKIYGASISSLRWLPSDQIVRYVRNVRFAASQITGSSGSTDTTPPAAPSGLVVN